MTDFLRQSHNDCVAVGQSLAELRDLFDKAASAPAVDADGSEA